MNTQLEKIGVLPIELLAKIDDEGLWTGDGNYYGDENIEYIQDLIEQDIGGEVVVI